MGKKVLIFSLNRLLAVWLFMMFSGVFALRAQKIYLTDAEPTARSVVLTYSWGIAGYASSHGISAWDVDGKGGGVANTLRLMTYSSSNSVGYGLLLYDDMHSQRFRDEGVKEKVNLLYVAPQASYLKRTTLFPSCFGTMGGGAGYVHYQSKSTFSGHPDVKTSASSVGLNAFLNLEYTFARHWGVCLEVNALYSPLTPSEVQADFIPWKQRDKFGLFVLTTQLGISCHF